MPDIKNILPLNSIWALLPSATAHVLSMIKQSMTPQSQKLKNSSEAEPFTNMNGNAVISITGPIVREEGTLTKYYGFTSANSAQLAMQQAESDPNIRRAILHIDSPGGSVDGLAELADVIFEARQSMPIIAHVNGICASAAFHIASQAHEIRASRMNMIGSIGARMQMFDFSEMFEKEGIKTIVIDTGVHKSAGAMGTKITDEQIAHFQGIVDAFFIDFKSAIIRGRPELAANLDELADGRMFMAEDALENGLIDSISNFQDTVDEAFQDNEDVNSRRRTRAQNQLDMSKTKIFLQND